MSLVIIIIVIILIIIVLFVSYQYVTFKDTPVTHIYSEIRPTLKTGDVILFACKRLGSLTEKIAYTMRTKTVGSEYGHAGLVIKEGEHLYLIECTAYNHTSMEKSYPLNKKGMGGVRIIDLDILLQDYYKECSAVFAVMHINKAIPNQMIFDKLDKYQDLIFEDKKVLFSLAAIDFLSGLTPAKKALEFSNRSGDRDRKLMCSEFVCDILQELGVIDKYPSKLFWPHVLSNGTLVKLSHGRYSNPIKFYYELPPEENKLPVS
jgi:hypothetical protein